MQTTVSIRSIKGPDQCSSVIESTPKNLHSSMDVPDWTEVAGLSWIFLDDPIENLFR
jgi:hypothetical protein